MSLDSTARAVTLSLQTAFALSLLAWVKVGYSWVLCVIAVLPLLTPLSGLLRARRRTYAWTTLLAIPYIAVVLTELLANPAARWVAATSLLLVFAWFCTMILFLRVSRAPRE